MRKQALLAIAAALLAAIALGLLVSAQQPGDLPSSGAGPRAPVSISVKGDWTGDVQAGPPAAGWPPPAGLADLAPPENEIVALGATHFTSISLTEQLSVADRAVFNSDVHVQGLLTATGGCTFTTAVSQTVNMDVTGALTVAGDSKLNTVSSYNSDAITFSNAISSSGPVIGNNSLIAPASYFPLSFSYVSDAITHSIETDREVARFSYPMAMRGISATASTDVSTGGILTVSFWVDGTREPAQILVDEAAATAYATSAQFTPTINPGSVLSVGFSISETNVFSTAFVSMLFTTTHAE